MKKILHEIYRQIMNVPSFESQELKKVTEIAHLEYVNIQLEKAISQNISIIFLIGPFGSGKTTQINHFFSKNKDLKRKIRSFVRINNLDFAFLHITNYLSRFLFLLFFSLSSLILFYYFPFFSPLPILLIIAGFFTKSFGNLIYICHETFDNLFSRARKIIVIEDLERSPLSSSDQFAFISNLWINKRTYIITLGYDFEETHKSLKINEFAIKLGGAVIEVPLDEHANYQMIKKLDPFFPFEYKKEEREGWLSLFTFRELMMLKDQVLLRSDANKKPRTQEYVAVAFEFLIEKLQMTNQGLSLDLKAKKVVQFSAEKCTPAQLQYLSSFFQSIDPVLRIENPFLAEATSV